LKGVVEMETQDFNKKPLVEQIYDELLANIEKHDAFDQRAITRLKQMAAKGELKRPTEVMGAIKVPIAKHNETTGTGN
jgi:hypothetical protein